MFWDFRILWAYQIIRYRIKVISPQARMKLPKKRRCVVAVQQPRRNQKRRGANVDGGGGEIIFSISFEISSVAIRKSWEVFPHLSGYSNSKEEEMSKSRLIFSFSLNFLFRSARASCTTSGGPAMKIWAPCIQAYMPHESSGDSSNQPDGPMGSPRRLP